MAANSSLAGTDADVMSNHLTNVTEVFFANTFGTRNFCVRIYSFLSLCYEYLGGESNIMAEIRGRTIANSYWSCTCCLAGNIAILLVKPVMAFLTLVLKPLGRYEEGKWSPEEGYLDAQPYSPVLKFLTVKSVIFLSFWQGVLLALLGATSAIQPVLDSTGPHTYKHWHYCCWLSEFFDLHRNVLGRFGIAFAFPISVYAGVTIRSNVFDRRQVTLQSISSSLKETMNPRDIMQDAIHNFHPQYQQYTQF
ncbi:Transmembrane protein [Trichinella pseudospiralis]